MNSASTPGGYGTQPSPYFPQYGGPPGPMTPQGNFAVHSFSIMSVDLVLGPSPVGRPAWETAQQHPPYGGQAMPGQGMPGQGLPGQGMPGHGMPNQGYGQMPGSAGGYGRGQTTQIGGWNQGQPPQSYGNGYQNYQG